MSRAAPVGVLVMAHGTPAGPEDIEAFYTRIRRGRPPSATQLGELRARYAAIGGTSPLAARTRSQVAGIAAVLDERDPGRFAVGVGAKFSEPTIEEAASELARRGVAAVIGIVLTPHRSSMGSGEYLRRASAALEASGPTGRSVPFRPVEQWYDAPGFTALLADRVRAAIATLAPLDRERAVVLFTAHSLPARVLSEGDPYAEQVARSAAAIAEAAGLADWRVAWQSAGRTPEPWIGPDVLAVLRSLAEDGATAAVICPVGFVADHLEVLYDLDVEAHGVAREAGLAFARTASLNDDPQFVAVLAEVVRTAAHGLARG